MIGGGPAGLTAALAIARLGLSVALVASPPPADARATAVLDGSLRFLRRLGIWNEIAAKAAPLKRLRIVDTTGGPLRAADLLFSAGEIGLDAFGQMVANADLAAALLHAVRSEPNVTLFEEPASEIVAGDGGVEIRLAGGSQIAAKLLAGADGRNSISRSAAGIAVRRWSYPQTALVVNVRHERPHDDTSTEFHTREGPFTLAPLPGGRSAVVCVVKPETAARLAERDDESLGADLTARSHRLLGDLIVDGERGVFPVGGLAALRFAANRIALVGEAAHVLPPIGAQGLNLGLRDAEELAEQLALRRSVDPGSPALQDAYHRARQSDVGSRTLAVDLLNRSLISGLFGVHMARGIGSSLLGRIGPLRRQTMRSGMMQAQAGSGGTRFLFKDRTATAG